MTPPDQRIALIGQKRWTVELARGLAEVGVQVGCIGVDTPRDLMSLGTLTELSSADLLVRVGLRPGAATPRGFALDSLLEALGPGRRREVMYWIGTDVIRAVRESESGMAVARWRSPDQQMAAHLAGSEPLQRELLAIGIASRTVPFPWNAATPDGSLPAMPDTFTVLTYIPDSRFEFYGGSLLVELARALPAVQFAVMGGEGSWVRQAVPNLTFLGWVDDPADTYSRASCVLRIPEHDSIGGTAVEGLMFGRPVLYNGELEYAIPVERTVESVLAAVGKLYDLHQRGALHVDARTSNWARSAFEPQSRFRTLRNALMEIAHVDEGTSG